MVATKTLWYCPKCDFHLWEINVGTLEICFKCKGNLIRQEWVSLDELRKAFDEHSNCKRQTDCCFEELKKRFFAPETSVKKEKVK